MGRWVLLGGKILITALLLYFAMRDVDFGAVWQRWERFDILWLLPAAALMTLQIIAAAWRWHTIGRALDESTPFRSRAWYLLISTFFAQTLPSFIGGDAMRVWLTRGTPGGIRAAVHAVAVDRGAGLLGLLLLVAVCLPGSWAVVDDARGRSVLALIVGGGFVGATAFFLFGRAAHWRRRLWAPARMLAALAIDARRTVLAPNPGLAIWASSLLVHLMTIGIILCLILGLAIDVGPVMVLYTVPPVILISFLPITVAGWGLREGAMVTALSYLGVAAPDALALSVLFGIMFLAQGTLGGFAWLSVKAQRPAQGPILTSHAE